MTLMTSINRNLVKIPERFEDFHNISSSMKHSFQNSRNIGFSLPGYVFCYSDTGSSYRWTNVLVSSRLTFKQKTDFIANEAGRLESMFIEITEKSSK